MLKSSVRIVPNRNSTYRTSEKSLFGVFVRNGPEGVSGNTVFEIDGEWHECSTIEKSCLIDGSLQSECPFQRRALASATAANASPISGCDRGTPVHRSPTYSCPSEQRDHMSPVNMSETVEFIE